MGKRLDLQRLSQLLVMHSNHYICTVCILTYGYSVDSLCPLVMPNLLLDIGYCFKLVRFHSHGYNIVVTLVAVWFPLFTHVS